MENNCKVDFRKATRIEEAAKKAIELVHEYSERDPYDDDENNPWKNPDLMLQELDHARTKVVSAWGKKSDDERKDDVIAATIDTEEFRAAYMDMVTDAFADALEEMRNNDENEELDVDILAECLQSGMDLFSSDEKALFLEDAHRDKCNNAVEGDKGDIDNEGITPHEKRRRQLGLNVHLSF